MCDQDITLRQIENVRQRLWELADEKGFTHNETVTVSQTLDSLLNQYNRIRYHMSNRDHRN